MWKIQDEYGFLRSLDWSTGDSCWQSSWHHLATCVLGATNKPAFDWVCKELDADPIGSVELFVKSFCKHCIVAGGFLTHPDGANKFTRDQLAALIVLGVAIHEYQPHLRGLYYPIVLHLCELDMDDKPLSDKVTGAKLNQSLRYIIGLLAKAYGVQYDKFTSKNYFYTALAAYQKMWENKGFFSEKVIPRPYTIWNNVGLYAAAYILDESVRGWRKLFTYYADNGWGVAYKIVAGKPYDIADADYYKTRKTATTEIMHQRGADHRKLPGGNDSALDYQIIHALRGLYE